MPRKRVINLMGDEKPILDLVSYGHPAVPLTPRQLTQITLTCRSAPEVMVKVSGGARTVSGVEQHMAYIGRNGELGLETDMGEIVRGKGTERAVVDDWNLHLDASRQFTERSIRKRPSPKLVHNLIFSMPPGTSPKALTSAVRKLAANEWQLKHRYAMTLHTDSRHPHVHVVVMAQDSDGKRLNIRKATLRSWRVQFAENLRELGVTANATERAVRGLSRTRKKDGIYRAARRGESTHVRQRQLQLAKEVASGHIEADAGADLVRRTRDDVLNGWRVLASKLRAECDHSRADAIRIFLGGLPPPMTEKESLLVMARKPERRPRNIDDEYTR